MAREKEKNLKMQFFAFLVKSTSPGLFPSWKFKKIKTRQNI
jgi:hypothetical protein